MDARAVNLQRKLDKEISSFVNVHLNEKLLSNGNKKLTFSDFFSNKLCIIHLIREGVPYSLFDLIRDYTPFSENDWSDFLEISTKSLQRYKQSSRQFKSLQSEKIIEIAEVTHAGLEVFGRMDKFKLWLDTPNFSLGSMKPVELLKDSYGKEMVLGELTRISYGILA